MSSGIKERNGKNPVLKQDLKPRKGDQEREVFVLDEKLSPF